MGNQNQARNRHYNNDGSEISKSNIPVNPPIQRLNIPLPKHSRYSRVIRSKSAVRIRPRNATPKVIIHDNYKECFQKSSEIVRQRQEIFNNSFVSGQSNAGFGFASNQNMTYFIQPQPYNYFFNNINGQLSAQPENLGEEEDLEEYNNNIVINNLVKSPNPLLQQNQLGNNNFAGAYQINNTNQNQNVFFNNVSNVNNVPSYPLFQSQEPQNDYKSFQSNLQDWVNGKKDTPF